MAAPLWVIAFPDVLLAGATLGEAFTGVPGHVGKTGIVYRQGVSVTDVYVGRTAFWVSSVGYDKPGALAAIEAEVS